MVYRIIYSDSEYETNWHFHKQAGSENIGLFKDFVELKDNKIIINYDKFKILLVDFLKKELGVLLIIDKKYACLDFPNLGEFPDMEYLLDTKYFFEKETNKSIISVEEYIIKGIIE